MLIVPSALMSACVSAEAGSPKLAVKRVKSPMLVARLGAQSNISVTKELAEALWLLTLGYPYSIRSLMNSALPARHRYPDLSALGEVLRRHQDGQLWNHYQEEFGKVSAKSSTNWLICLAFLAFRLKELRVHHIWPHEACSFAHQRGETN